MSIKEVMPFRVNVCPEDLNADGSYTSNKGYTYIQDHTDCRDSDSDSYPGAVEICDSRDNDCDDSVDEGLETQTYYADTDGDGYGSASSPQAACSAPTGYVADNTDCNDTSATSYPSNTEICDDSIDQDCDGSDLACAVTEDCTDGIDNDNDGLADCDDADCSNDTECVVATETNCSDTLDDDSDTFIDCGDSDCIADVACITPDIIETACGDELDDDGDTLIDCDDSDCYGVLNETTGEICPDPSGNEEVSSSGCGCQLQAAKNTSGDLNILFVSFLIAGVMIMRISRPLFSKT